MRILFIACYFPPMNSTGARRVTAFAANLAARGHEVVVVTPTKRPAHGTLTEALPMGVRVLELPRPSVILPAQVGGSAGGPRPGGPHDRNISCAFSRCACSLCSP